MKPRSFRRVPLREHDGLPRERTAVGDELLDLSGVSNRYGPPAALVHALREGLDAARHYPDMTGLAARGAVAHRFATAPDRVVLGHGACELLWTCARVLVRAEDTVLLVEPSYAELSAAVRQIGSRVVKWHAVERTGHRIDTEQIGELMTLEKPGIVGLCAPNSPTGVSLPMEHVTGLAARFPDTHFIVDQSLLALSDDHPDLEILPPSNVVCVRSVGKEIGMPGLRAGYLLADAALAVHFEASRPSYSTSTLAQLAIERSVGEEAHLGSCRSRLQEDRNRLAFVLSRLELTATPSVAPFLLVRMTHAPEVARDLLDAYGIAVHECTGFGLPDHLRIAGLPASHEKRFTVALREVLERRKLHKGREP